MASCACSADGMPATCPSATASVAEGAQFDGAVTAPHRAVGPSPRHSDAHRCGPTTVQSTDTATAVGTEGSACVRPNLPNGGRPQLPNGGRPQRPTSGRAAIAPAACDTAGERLVSVGFQQVLGDVPQPCQNNHAGGTGLGRTVGNALTDVTLTELRGRVVPSIVPASTPSSSDVGQALSGGAPEPSVQTRWPQPNDSHVSGNARQRQGVLSRGRFGQSQRPSASQPCGRFKPLLVSRSHLLKLYEMSTMRGTITLFHQSIHVALDSKISVWG